MWELKDHLGKMAVIDDHDLQLSYYDLQNISDELYEKINKRCLVFSLCTNSIGSILGYISFLNHKIVPVMLNCKMEIESLEKLLDIYHPSYLWMPRERRLDFSDYEIIYEIFDYVLLETKFEMIYELNEDLALLLTTSGSTGSPKFVRQSYENILENTKSIIEYLKLDSEERPITTLPMNYTYGLSIINSHIMVGATILVTEKSLMQKEFWSFFKKQKATSFGGVPYTYEILDKLRFYMMDLPSLKTMTQAGGKITPELHEKFAEYAQKNHRSFVVMYGQCEATARMGYLPPEKALEKKGSMGIAIPGGTFRLIDAEGKKIETADTVGELVYEGKNVTLGYAERGEDLRKGDERHGILYTGDMAKYDEDGYYYITGRKKRFLKIYGNRVNLDEIDQLIKGKFEVECASGGIDDHMYIFITQKELMEQVKSFIVHKTGLNPTAFHMVNLEKIPKNDSGKTLYKELEKYYDR